MMILTFVGLGLQVGDLDAIVMSVVSVEGPINKADMIIVYGGGSGRRIAHAAELAEAGYSENILILGTKGEMEFAASILSPWLTGRNINLLLPGKELPDTFASAVFAADYIEKAGIQNALIVSDDWHLRRVSLLMKDKTPVETNLMFSHPQSQMTNWWKHVGATAMLAKECAKVAICTIMTIV